MRINRHFENGAGAGFSGNIVLKKVGGQINGDAVAGDGLARIFGLAREKVFSREENELFAGEILDGFYL